MTFSKSKDNYEPFYKFIYSQALARLKAGRSIENIYDDRGPNIVRHLRLMTNRSTYRQALDIGCGLGQVAVSLAAKCKTVVAADISKDALKVVAEVEKKRKMSNLYPVLVDTTQLPFRDGVFDLIVCSGALEWVSSGNSSKSSPERLQLYALKETRRVMCRPGLFWLGIENRCGYGYLLGFVDHHSGLRFVTFLPRFIAGCYSRLVKKQPYRTYLYNYWELRKMLRKTGLAVNSFQTAFPYYSNPKVIVDISDHVKIARAANISQLNLSYSSRLFIRVISNLHLTKLLISNFVVMCTKS